MTSDTYSFYFPCNISMVIVDTAAFSIHLVYSLDVVMQKLCAILTLNKYCYKYEPWLFLQDSLIYQLMCFIFIILFVDFFLSSCTDFSFGHVDVL
jgi:hypothetical protein